MTQASEAPASVQTPAAGEGSPGAAALALPPEMLADLAPALREGLEPAAPATDDDADDEGTPTPAPSLDAPEAGLEPPTEGEGDDAGEPDTSPSDEVREWADQLFDNPQLATRIPRARMPEVFAEFRNRVQVAYDYGVEQGKAAATVQAQTATLRQQAAAIEQLLEEGDLDAYNEAVEKFPGGKRAFKRVAAELEPVAAGSAEYYTNQAKTIMERLAEFPDAQRELIGRWNYPASEEGLRTLAVDVGVALEKARSSKQQPAQDALRKTQAGLQGLRQKPKPDTSEGRSTPINSDPTPDEIRAMTSDQILALEEKNPGFIVRAAAAVAKK